MRRRERKEDSKSKRSRVLLIFFGVVKMTINRRGKPASDNKIREALQNARNINEVYDLLERGRFNLTDAEERKIAQDWVKVQMSLKIHGKGAYAVEAV